MLEWLAWHQLAGFDHFYIADNGSCDGTRELLEALEALGHLTLIHQPVVEKPVQLIAYQRIASLALGRADVLLYIDADEFLVDGSGKVGSEVRALATMFAADVGSVSLNWRLFGASGHETAGDGLVLERFTYCAMDRPGSKNGHLKTAVRVPYIKEPGPHRTRLSAPLREVDGNGNPISDCVVFSENGPRPVKRSGCLARPVSSGLRIHHYVVKSREEFINKKRRRGSAMRGADHDKGMAYFRAHDINEQKSLIPLKKLKRLKAQVALLEKKLRSHVAYGGSVVGSVDISNRHEVQGWALNRDWPDVPVRVQIFVNGVLVGSVDSGFHRQDLVDAKVSGSGLHGFRWRHPAPLVTGDQVVVRIYANESVLPGHSSITVE